MSPKLMTPEENRKYDEQLEIFVRLRDRIDEFLEKYGRPDTLLAPGDYSAHDDFRGTPQVKVSVGNLELLRPHIVDQLQQIVKKFSGWEIVYAVVLDDHIDDWPNMGLYIRGNEIIDGLQRQYFPKEFQNIAYVGAKPGTEDD